MMNKEELILFEDEIKLLYEQGKIRAPVHLSGGNEDALLSLFKQIKKDDWVFSTHRSHYHALLHGIDKSWVKQEILNGNSISLVRADHHFYSSAIMGGVIPIALGVALALKRKGSSQSVWVFIGDMAAEMGVFHESLKYAERHDLPITYIIEDNGMSIETPTQKVWGSFPQKSKCTRYSYKRSYPHHGVGKWVSF
ncbi:hypothetical protein HZC31_08345 [Candidatus Woesearchaeota archaeon]|nr:hypothetical protein [Candidatus Woesearchaeota archaeon]